MVDALGRFADVLLRAALAQRATTGDAAADLVARLPSFAGAAALPKKVAHEITSVRAELHASLAGTEPFGAVAANAGLDAAASELLALLVAVEVDPARQELVAALQGGELRPTLGLARALLPAGALRSVAPDGRLVRAGLVLVPQEQPWARRPMLVDGAVVWAVLGDPSVDPGLPVGTRWVDGRSTAGDATLLLVPGADPVRRLRIATCHAAGARFLVVPSPSDDDGWRAVVREATLTGRGVVVQLDDELAPLGTRWVERADHLVWVLASRVELPVEQAPGRPWREVRADDAVATIDELHAAFGPKAEVVHRLTAQQVEQASRVLAANAEPDADDVTAAVRRLASGELDRLAVRVRPRRSWDELVLPHEQLATVRDVVDRYRHRARVYGGWGFAPVPSAGVVALFAGPPGTGKTLSAEVIASELGLDLFRIDLATLVSKYVGETEKNLERVFRAAEGGTMVLVFDEADAVFGKRSDVSDAHDRYANVETSYLLQRLERYAGIVVLTTNYASNIDDAFQRRIHVHVEFTAPDEAERLRLWTHAFPPDAPVDDLDGAFLARQFTLTGAAIRSVGLAAAFKAAATTGRIGMAEVLGALRAELRKQGRLTDASAFEPYTHLLAGGPDGPNQTVSRGLPHRRHGARR